MSTDTMTATQVYRVYIKATPQAIWDAITKPEWTERYGYTNRADFDLHGVVRTVARDARPLLVRLRVLGKDVVPRRADLRGGNAHRLHRVDHTGLPGRVVGAGLRGRGALRLYRDADHRAVWNDARVANGAGGDVRRRHRGRSRLLGVGAIGRDGHESDCEGGGYEANDESANEPLHEFLHRKSGDTRWYTRDHEGVRPSKLQAFRR